jgi:beta-1,4-mannosyltransferase
VCILQILLEACIQYDTAVIDTGKAAAASALPPMLVIITGRGPQQEMYRDKLATLNLTSVSFHMAWLEPQHYSVALASADVGVSLHASSSELDLPMKVSDMLGWCVASFSTNLFILRCSPIVHLASTCEACLLRCK